MAQWALSDAAGSSPKFGAQSLSLGSGATAMAANNTALYGNTTASSFIPSQVVGMFAVNSTELANTSGEAKRINHTGWNLRKAGVGPLANVTITAGGTGYSNSDLFKLSGGAVNAAGTLVTNSTGGITTVTITNYGSGFVNVSSSTEAVTNSTAGASAGSGATFTFNLGGRAGRVSYETIVAGSISSNGTSDDTQFPQ